MGGYLIIYVKKDRIGHVRYEIGDDRGYKEIRGLSESMMFVGKTIYEKGEEDSHEISVYNREKYLPSEKIPLTREELVGAIAYTRENDIEPPSYWLFFNNCNDFTSGVLAAAGKEGCVGDYLSAEQKEEVRASSISDLLKCKIPQEVDNADERIKERNEKIKEAIKEKITETVEKAQEKNKEAVCSGFVFVKGYVRNNEYVDSYVRKCGRH